MPPTTVRLSFFTLKRNSSSLGSNITPTGHAWAKVRSHCPPPPANQRGSKLSRCGGRSTQAETEGKAKRGVSGPPPTLPLPPWQPLTSPPMPINTSASPKPSHLRPLWVPPHFPGAPSIRVDWNTGS